MNLSKVMEKTNLLNLRNSANQACVLLKNMANEDRLMLLCQLSQGEKKCDGTSRINKHSTTHPISTIDHLKRRRFSFHQERR